MLCAVLRFLVGEEFSNIPLFGISLIGIISGILVGVITVLIAASSPAKRAAKVSPVTAVSGNTENTNKANHDSAGIACHSCRAFFNPSEKKCCGRRLI